MAVSADKARDQTNETATATLSQLAARVLNQLALSAWLPSAALVLIAAYVLQLASVLDEARVMAAASATNHEKPPTALTHLEAVTQAFDRLGGTSAGGIVLMAYAASDLVPSPGQPVRWRTRERTANFSPFSPWQTRSARLTTRALQGHRRDRARPARRDLAMAQTGAHDDDPGPDSYSRRNPDKAKWRAFEQLRLTD
jgi:hypothetical protein